MGTVLPKTGFGQPKTEPCSMCIRLSKSSTLPLAIPEHGSSALLYPLSYYHSQMCIKEICRNKIKQRPILWFTVWNILNYTFIMHFLGVFRFKVLTFELFLLSLHWNQTISILKIVIRFFFKALHIYQSCGSFHISFELDEYIVFIPYKLEQLAKLNNVYCYRTSLLILPINWFIFKFHSSFFSWLMVLSQWT